MIVIPAKAGIHILLRKCMSKSNEQDSPIKFPCDFIVKITGKNDTDFEKKVIDVITRHYPDFTESSLTKRSSKNKNYLALSVTVHAENKAQLDALYLELNSLPEVLMTL